MTQGVLSFKYEEEKKRKKGAAFIPASNKYLSGLCGINKAMLEYLQLHRPQAVATIDMDATLIESNKEEALFCYKKFKGYQPMNAWWWIMLLSLNLTVLLKSLVLDKNWKASRMKRIRYWLINVPGRVILKGKDLVVRLTRGHPAFGLLVDARRRIAALGLDAFGDMAPAPG